VNFNLNSLNTYIKYTSDLRKDEKDKYKLENGYDINKFLNDQCGIKGFFFVRQKRIPTTIANGLVVGLTTKDFGNIPILSNNNGTWSTKSFLSKGRLVLSEGSTIQTQNDNTTRVVNQALLVPDAELQESTFNQIFTSQEFTLDR
jgi:hypothetical protein